VAEETLCVDDIRRNSGLPHRYTRF
jgi:hypothetical protein